MSLLPFFTWCENSPLGESIRASLWLFPVVESVHLLALSVIGGTVLLVSLRLLGWGMRRQSAAQLWHETRPWLWGGLLVMLASGLILFTSEAVKLYYSDAFWVKMTALLLATAFTFTVVRRVALAGETRWSQPAGLISLLLWFCVGAAGRWIGFS